MAASAEVRPNGSSAPNGSWTLAGASAHAALADDSDSTYIAAATTGLADDCELSFPDPTIPAGAYPIGLVLNLRTKKAAGTNRWSSGFLGAAGMESFERIFFQGLTSWTSPTTFYATNIPATLGEQLDTTDPVFLVSGSISKGVTFYEALIVAIYVEQPTLTASTSAATHTTDNRPPIYSSRTLDFEGGTQSRYEMKIYDATTHGAFGSVDPDVTAPYFSSGEIVGSESSLRPTVGLPDDDYRAFVRIAQSVNGETFWSEWDSTDFAISVDLPAVPTLAATAENTDARILLELDENAGAATTSWWEIEASDDGSEWTALRTTISGGIVTNPTPGSSGSASAYDHEGSSGATRYFRARAVKDHGLGLTVASAWTATVSASWTSASWWLKHPEQPSLNQEVSIFSQPGISRPSRSGTFQGLGSSRAILISDFPSPPQGEITFSTSSAAEKAALDAIVASTSPLLLQAPAGTHWSDRWIALMNQERTPNVDKLAVADALDRFDWAEVDRPSSLVLEWAP